METGVNYVVYSSVLEHLSRSLSGEVSQSHVPSPLRVTDDHHEVCTGKRESSREEVSGSTPTVATAAPEPTLRNVAFAAATSGFALSFILSPTELVKCRMQVRVSTLDGQRTVHDHAQLLQVHPRVLKHTLHK